MLAPGGTFCIVDPAGDEAREQDDKGEDGYVKESRFLLLAERAGFVLAATSDVNRNARDTKDHANGVYSLPPTLRGTEEGTPERAALLAIGESDRFTHRYIRPAAAAGDPTADVRAARALFDANLKAIQDKNREAYLATYRPDDALVRTGFAGPELGFAGLAEGTAPTGSDEWPEELVAEDVQLHPVAPGVVYGTYKYTVTFDGVTTSGLSERVFQKRGDRWYIAVTTAFEGPPAKSK
jgi:hypothetical protein